MSSCPVETYGTARHGVARCDGGSDEEKPASPADKIGRGGRTAATVRRVERRGEGERKGRRGGRDV